MSKEVKRFFIMPGAVPVMQSDSPAYTPMTNHETYVHTVPVVLASDYDALLAERDALAAILDKCRGYLRRAHEAFMLASRSEEARHRPGHDLYMQIDAALQGEQQ